MLCEQKGVLDLIKAFRGLSPDVVLSIAGGEVESGFVNRINTLIDSAGVTDRVRLLGPVSGDEKTRLFADNDIFVLPSYVEALPMSLLEAMAYGMTIVATDVGAIPTAVTDGEEAILFRPGDVPALTRALQELISNPVRREQMGSSARRRCEREYGSAVGEQRLIVLYDDLLGRNSKNLVATS
jgi:glycosyltransferase involved in cell wall biosynthesis